MIDLHSHILPGVDDGARTLEDAIEMAKSAAADGIRVIAATPHHNNGRYTNTAETILNNVIKLNEELSVRGIPIEVIGGQEIRVNDNIWKELEQGNLLPLNGSRYVLIEFPSSTIPSDSLELIHELRVAGYVPIIAHPERNSELASNPDRLEELVNHGALAQLTSHSLFGLFGKKLSQLSLELCRRNLIHIIASDAHDMIHRGFGLSEAYSIVRDKLGVNYERMLRDNAEGVLNNQLLQVPPTLPRVKKKFWLF